MKLYTLNKVIEELSLAYPNVREYHYGDVYEAMNRSRDIEYASMVLTHQTTDVIDDYTRNHTFNLFYIDRLLQDESNKLEIQSQGQEVLEGILANLENVGIEVLDDRQYINFTQKFADLCAGCYVTFIAQVPIEDCDGNEIRIVNTVDGRSGDVHLSDLYASKEYVDSAIESAVTSGIDLDNYWTSAQTEQAITQAISGKADASVVYTKSETDAKIAEQGNTFIDNLTVGQIDMTTHSSAGTCNINGVNKITASSGDIATLSSHTVNATSVNVQYMGSSKNVASWINQKLDASAYTPTDLSDYYTKEQVDSAISSSVSNAITGVSFNGTAATVTDGVAYITVDFYSIIESYMNRFRVVYVSGGTTYIDEYPDGIVNTTKYKNSTAITSVEIGDEITTLPSSMFENDTNLKTIKIGNKVGEIPSSFAKGCSTLSSATIPNGVTSIGGNAFQNCSGLTEFTIPNSVTTFGYGIITNSGVRTLSIGSGASSLGYALYDIPYLDSITVDGNNPTYDSRNNCNAIIVTSTNKLILGASNTIIPNDVTTIGSYAFQHLLNLTSLTIPNSVTEIENSAFFDCSNLSSITCYGTTSPTLGNTNVFYNLPSVGTLYVPQGSDYSSWIGTGATSSSQLASGWTIQYIDVPTNADLVLHLSGDTDETYNYANGEIPRSGFKDRTDIIGIEIGSAITKINSYAFSGCNSITSVTIPSGVTEIGNFAFEISSLVSFTCLSTTPPDIHNYYIFSTLSTFPIYVPSESVETYKTAGGWSQYATRIQAIP